VATYWVEDGHGGSDSGTEANPYLTIQQALDVVGAGDHVWVKASGTYNEALTTSTAGTAASPITFEGFASSTGDEGVVTNDGTTGTLAEGWQPISGSNYYNWKNFHFTNFSGTAFGDTDGDYINLYRVRGSSSGEGIELDDYCELVACAADGNTNIGIQIGSLGTFYKCVSQGNGSAGIRCTAGMFVVDCLVYDNTGNGIDWTGANAYGMFVGNTVVAPSGGSTKGMQLGSANTANRFICANNTVSGYSGGGGIGIETASIGERALCFNNNVYNCETPYSGCSDLGGGTTSDPDFVDAGSDDYTPGVSSSLTEAGLDVENAPGAPTQSGALATVGTILAAAAASGGLGLPNKRGNMQ
jgi:hypothetical protein